MGKHESAKTAVIHTNVHIGEPTDMPGFGLAVDIKVEGADEDVIKAAHEVSFFLYQVSRWQLINYDSCARTAAH